MTEIEALKKENAELKRQLEERRRGIPLDKRTFLVTALMVSITVRSYLTSLFAVRESIFHSAFWVSEAAEIFILVELIVCVWDSIRSKR